LVAQRSNPETEYGSSGLLRRYAPRNDAKRRQQKTTICYRLAACLQEIPRLPNIFEEYKKLIPYFKLLSFSSV